MSNDTINGVIYMIKHKTDDTKKVYIGSTKDFKTRITNHKYNFTNDKKKEYNLNVYQYIRENGGWDEYEFVILENIKCNLKCELLDKEDEYILKYKDTCLNCIRAFLTDEELAEHIKEYYNKNRDKYKEYYQKNRNRIKEYYENNRESIAEKRKEYREINRNAIAEKRKEKLTCECGVTYTKCHKARHERSNYHQQFIKNNVTI